MNITYREKLLAYLALISGLAISVVAIYYSVSGLVSIFSAAVTPIIIMGVTLEVSKLIATLWLKQNWSITPFSIKTYLLIAIIILMTITSMGIYGFLAKAHTDQAVPSKDIIDKISILDDKISTQKENIQYSRDALQQLDAAVDQTMIRSTSEQGATRAINVRKSQNKERSQLQNDISTAQQEISKLTEEKSPYIKQLHNVEAEVGPIKYIAALIYGDQINDNILEKSVQWVIVLIVSIFDPLAVVLLLASQYSFQHFKRIEETDAANHYNSTVTSEFTWDTVPTYNDYHQENQSTTVRKGVRYKVPNINEIDINSLKNAKRKFKKENPDKTLHEYEIKKDLGVIEKLPWEDDIKDN